MAYSFMQGKYTLQNPSKYEGNHNNVTFRSSWELVAMKWCDRNPKVLRWSSEEVVIPYVSPVDGRKHRYFMDLKITFAIDDDKERTVLVEIKPEAQTKPPRKAGKPETYLENCKTWAVNQAKWKAAEEYAKSQGWGFMIWTESHLLDGVEHDKEIQKDMANKRRENRINKTKNSLMRRRARKLVEQRIQMINDKKSS